MSVALLLRDIQKRGISLSERSDGRLVIRGKITDDERFVLRENKAEVLRLIADGGPPLQSGSPSSQVNADEWESLRRLAPRLGRNVVLDGRSAVLWGITPHGAIVDVGSVLLTVAPEAVGMV